MSGVHGGLPEIVVVTSPACHFCDDALAALSELDSDHGLRLRRVDITSAEGLALAALHRPAMYPMVLLDGEFFSAGRLPRGKLRKALAREHRLEVTP
jgi:hypothetical protein